MNRKTLTALGVLGVVAIVAAIVLKQPEKGQRVGERQRPVPRLKAGDFDTLAVTKGGATTTVKKAGDKYTIVAPMQYSADENVGKQAFEAIEKLEFGDLVTDQTAKHAEFEVDDKGLKVVVRKGDKELAQLLVGKSMGGHTLTRVPGKNEVWQGLGSFKYNFDRDATNWRDKTIVKFTQADAEKIEIKNKGGTHIALKKEGDDKWTITESTTPTDKPDTTIPSGIVSTLANWVTNEFADGAKPADTGLDDPATTVTLSLKGGKTVSVLIGNKKGDDERYVKSADNPQVFVVKRYNVDRVDKRPIDFGDKTICDIAEGDLGEVAVAHEKDSYTLTRGDKDKDWKAAKPAGLALDTSKVSTITSAFKDWKASGFAEDQSPKTGGLAKPKATIVARSKDRKKSCSVKVGDETKDKSNYIAQASSGTGVYLVAKWSADRLLTKVEDLKKKDATPPMKASPH
jgi:hypothetical protein